MNSPYHSVILSSCHLVILSTAIPIARIIAATIVGAEGVADGDRVLEVAGIPPAAVWLLRGHGAARAHGPIGVPGAGHHSKAREKVAVATITASPSRCFLLRSDKQGRGQQRRPQKLSHDDFLTGFRAPELRYTASAIRHRAPKPLPTRGGAARRNYSREVNFAD